MNTKTCRQCKVELPINYFSKNKQAKDKLEYICKQCRSKKHFDHKERNNKVSLTYYYNHTKERREKAKRWKQNNKERNLFILKEWKRKHKAEIKAYKKAHPEDKKIKNFRERRRRIKKIQNGGSHTLKEWEGLKKKYNYMCLCCKKNEPEIKLTEDHIVPLHTGGTDNIENIQPLCQGCNSIKWTQTINFRTLEECDL